MSSIIKLTEYPTSDDIYIFKRNIVSFHMTSRGCTKVCLQEFYYEVAETPEQILMILGEHRPDSLETSTESYRGAARSSSSSADSRIDNSEEDKKK